MHLKKKYHVFQDYLHDRIALPVGCLHDLSTRLDRVLAKRSSHSVNSRPLLLKHSIIVRSQTCRRAAPKKPRTSGGGSIVSVMIWRTSSLLLSDIAVASCCRISRARALSQSWRILRSRFNLGKWSLSVVCLGAKKSCSRKQMCDVISLFARFARAGSPAAMTSVISSTVKVRRGNSSAIAIDACAVDPPMSTTCASLREAQS